MNTYVDRLRSERESLHIAVTGIAERAAAEGRDITPDEEETVKRAGVRTDEIDRHLSEFTGQLAAANRYAAMVEQTDAELVEHDSRRGTATPTVTRSGDDGVRNLTFGGEFVRAHPDGWNTNDRFELDRSLLERALIATDTLAVPPSEVGAFTIPDGPSGAASVVGKGTVATDTIHYVVVNSPTHASVVAEGIAKPEAAFTFTPATAPVVTIAWWVPVTRQALQDTSYLGTLLDGLLRRGVLRRLNAEIVNGDGTGGDITGIATAAGTLPVTGPASPGTILSAIATVEAAGYYPNAVLAHPSTIGTLAAAASTSGGYLADATGALQRITTMFGVPLVPDVNVPTGTAYVSDFSATCTLWDRMQTAVFTGEQHADNFTKNIITLLAEGRWGFTVQEPGGIAEVTFA